MIQYDRIWELVQELRQAETWLDSMKEIERRVQKLREVEIPELVGELPYEMFERDGLVLPDGSHLTLQKTIHASIAQKSADDACGWLTTNGHGGMVRLELVMEFGPGQDDAAEVWAKTLALNDNFELRQKRTVNPSTLRAWVRGRLEAGEVIPPSIDFYVQRIAKIKENNT